MNDRFLKKLFLNKKKKITQELSNRGGNIPNFLERFLSEPLGRDRDQDSSCKWVFFNIELSKFKTWHILWKMAPQQERKMILAFLHVLPWIVYYCRGFNIWNLLKDPFVNNMYWALLMCQAICFAALEFFFTFEHMGPVRVIAKAEGRPTWIIQGNTMPVHFFKSG